MHILEHEPNERVRPLRMRLNPEVSERELYLYVDGNLESPGDHDDSADAVSSSATTRRRSTRRRPSWSCSRPTSSRSCRGPGASARRGRSASTSCSLCSTSSRWPEERSIGVLRRPPETHTMNVEVEVGVDLSLITMLLTAADQLLLSHSLRNYDVDWQGDLWLLESCSGTARGGDGSKRNGCLCIGSMK